jgi:hypothetical protein
MKRILEFVLLFILLSCNSISQSNGVILKKELPKSLKEISGICYQNNAIWAISDKPHPNFFRLDPQGNVVQEVHIQNATVTDVEAITADGPDLYIGDVGDNNGSRASRTIYKVAINKIGKEAVTDVTSSKIKFTFSDEGVVEGKKENDFDCEAIVPFKDSLYLITKRRTDDQSELYVIPKTPGTYVARLISKLDTKGLITDAAMNPSKNELALAGYEKGHEHPFVILIKNFKGNDLFSGEVERIELTNNNKEFQMEGITFKTSDVLYLSCEETKNNPATIYSTRTSMLNSVFSKKSSK